MTVMPRPAICLRHVYVLLGFSLLAFAFALRLVYWEAGVFQVDEYISMLAVQMTVEKGAPVLPSGLLYSQGAIFSYLAAVLVRLVGFSEEIVRWLSMLAGLLVVVLFWRIAHRLFNSRAAAMIALALAALDPSMIVWAGRARMYAVAHVFVMLTLYFLLMGFVVRPGRRYRLAAALSFLAATLSHSVTVVMLPPLVLAVLIVVWLSQKYTNQAWASHLMRWELGMFALIASLAVGVGVAYQVPNLSPSAGESGGQANGVLASIGGVLAKFLDPGLGWNRVDDYVYWFTLNGYLFLSVLVLAAVGHALYHLVKGRAAAADMVTIFLGLVTVLTVGELAFLLDRSWRETRYMYLLGLTPFVLAASWGLAHVGALLGRRLHLQGITWQQAGPLAGGALIVAFGLLPALDAAGTEGTGGYNEAFGWVKAQWQPGDLVATVHPSASYLYLGRGDFYASQDIARVLLDPETEENVDRYIGSPLIDSVPGLNAALDAPGRLWFVVDTGRLFSRYSPLFSQQVFARMDMVQQSGIVLVFLEKPGAGPLPAEPSQLVEGDWPGIIALGGFNFDRSKLAPGASSQLDLYWRPAPVVPDAEYKIFVHLRNGDNETVAQADHFLLQGYVRGEILLDLAARGEWLRESVLLNLPLEYQTGEYRLLVGLYDPGTFERPALANDASGENAVVLEVIPVP